ncbi:MAG: carbon monoxide dehydrogenase, partial [Desulfobacterales bacterium]
MADIKATSTKSTDPAVRQMIAKAERMGVTTVWDRYGAMLPQCGFGDTGLCCRNCLQGPCRIDPFGEGPSTGICGATADVMVARGLDRAIAAGTAAHSGHARHLAHTLLKMAQNETEDYAVKEGQKLKAVAKRLNIPVDDRADKEIALDVARAALADFHEKETPVMWAATVVTPQRAKVLTDLGLVPKGIDHEISEIMHRTIYGVDADPVNLLLGGLRCGVADLAGCYMGTDLADILFGIPRPTVTACNLGTLKAGAVNIAVHGHNPVLSDILVTGARAKEQEAIAAGASGINLVGI